MRVCEREKNRVCVCMSCSMCVCVYMCVCVRERVCVIVLSFITYDYIIPPSAHPGITKLVD